MKRCFDRLPRTAAAAACALALLLSQTAGRAADRQVLNGHLFKAVAGLQPIDRLASTNHLKLAINLPLRDAVGLTNLLRQIYDPASPSFHHYLTPAQFAESFGPTEADYAAVIAFAQSNNLTVTGRHPNRAVLDVEGSVADIERTFDVELNVYQHPTENRKFYAPNREPSVNLSTALLHIDGLDNFVVAKPLIRHKAFVPGATNAGTGSGPFGNYWGYDYRNAYVPGVSLTGAGQNIALLELDGYDQSDVTSYEQMSGLPAVHLTNILVDDFNGIPFTTDGDGEVTLDIDMDISMAPGASLIMVYEATNGFTAPITDMLNQIATDDAANQVSSSWLIGDESAWDKIYLQYAAQGQSFYQASGDNGGFVWSLQNQERADDPNVTLVGGTTLTTAPGGAWLSETVWNWNSTVQGTDGQADASGGGISPNYTIPTWQLGISMANNGGSTTYRDIPDVALTADNIYIIVNNGVDQPGTGGTSAAAPLWAAFTALVNQQAVIVGKPPVGFLNPTIYSICKGPLYGSVMHDIITGNDTNANSPTQFYATKGYDLCTGWGTPTGSNLIDALVPLVFTPVLAVSTNIITGGNGNGVIDYDECDNLSIILTNEGNAEATGIQGVLSSTTPGVIVAQPNATFPDLLPKGSAAGITAFTISTEPTFICGTPVNLTLIVKSDQVIQTNYITLPSGVLGSPDSFTSTGAVPIPIDVAGVNSTVNVSGLESAGKITVSTYISALYDSGLTLQLIAPNGASVLLSQNNGSLGANYGNGCVTGGETTFDDAAPESITVAAPPYVGTFSPQQPLSAFNLFSGTNLNGIWTLNVVDEFPGDTATLNCWTLNISPEVCEDGGGECPGSDLSLTMSASPNTVLLDSNLVFNLVVSNAGPSDAQGVAISQTLPPGLGFVTTSNYPVTVSQSGNTLNLSLGTLPVYGTALVSVITIPTIPGLVTSVATVGSTGSDPNPNNNTASATADVVEPGADLAVTISASPTFVLQGGALTYTIVVTNNGPFTATDVTLANTLPPNVNVISTSTTQGTISPNGTFADLGTLDFGSNATVTVVVSPTVTGSISATAQVSLSPLEVDPVSFNNTSSVTVTVGPSADLGVSGYGLPPTILSGANYTNVATVVNNGPSPATNVFFSQTVPAGVSFVSSSVSGVVVTNGVISWSINALADGASVSITNILKSPVLLAGVPSEQLTSVLTVFGQPGDANTNNNTAILQALVEPPTITIVPVNAVLTSQSFTPPDGSIHPGETVQILLNLQNTGNVNTTNLVATLQSTGGVTLPSGSQTYGVLAAGAPPVGRLYSFTANSTNGGTVVATLQLQDGSANLGSVAFTFYMPVVTTFWNTGRIDIPNKIYVPEPDAGPANPYPSLLSVSNITGFVSDVTVTLSNMSHSYPNDVSMLLVGPDGQDVVLMANAAAQAPVGMVDETLIFDQDASNALPAFGQIVAGTYRPADYYPSSYSFSNAPAGPYGTNLDVFSGISPNGVWSLYAYDNSAGDAGGISNGWAVTVTTITPVSQSADMAANIVALTNQITLGNSATFLLSVTNNGPSAANAYLTNILPAGFSFVSSSVPPSNYVQTGQVVLYTLGTLDPGAGLTITNVLLANSGGFQTNTVIAASPLPDPNSANNSASVVTSVSMPFADVAAGIAATPNPAVVGSNLVYTLVVTNLGPSNAFNVAGSFSLTNLNFVSAAPSQGTAVVSGGGLQCTFGTVPPGDIATVVVIAAPSTVGFLTNVWTVSTSDQDTNLANNTIAADVSVINPVAVIVAGSDSLVAQGGNMSNGAINSNETVTVTFTLINVGSASTTNLTASLEGNAGLAPITFTQDYGAIAPGASGTQPYTFTAQGAPGATITATLILADTGSSLGSVSFVFQIPSVNTYSQTGEIIIPEYGPATPYPSEIQVSGLSGLVSKVTATLNGFSHTFPHDVNVLLADPAGQEMFLMSHVGGAYSVTNLTLAFADSATQTLPAGQLFSGVFLPTAVTPLNPLPGVPAASSATNLAFFNGSNPNGDWSLYVFDDTQGNAGVISGGWSLGLTTVDTVNPAARLEATMIHEPDPVFSGNYLNYLITISNLGPSAATSVVLTDSLPSSVAYSSAIVSQGTVTNSGSTVTCNLGTLASGATATATIRVIAGAAGNIVNTATVTTASTDLYLADSTTANTTSVDVPPVSLLEATNYPNGLQLTLQGQPSQNYGIQVSTNLINWTTVTTNTSSFTGVFTFTDSNTNSPGRFYRAIRIPQ